MKKIRLKYEAVCYDCGAHLPAGSEAAYYGRGRIYGRRCHQFVLDLAVLDAALERSSNPDFGGVIATAMLSDGTAACVIDLSVFRAEEFLRLVTEVNELRRTGEFERPGATRALDSLLERTEPPFDRSCYRDLLVAVEREALLIFMSGRFAKLIEVMLCDEVGEAVAEIGDRDPSAPISFVEQS